MRILLPETKEHPDLHIATTRTYKGKNWDTARKLPNKNGRYMCTLPLFIEHINLLFSDKDVYDSTGKKLSSERRTALINDITEVAL